AHHLGSMMERSFQSDLRIVESLCIKFQFGTAGASSEEVDRAAFAYHIHSPLPRLRASHGFNYNVRSALLRREGTDSTDRISDGSDLHRLVGTEATGVLHLLIALYYGDYSQSAEFCDLHEHQSDRSCPNNYDAIAFLRMSLIQSVQYASERLTHRSRLKADLVWDAQHVAGDNSTRHLDVFRVRAVVEEKVFAKIRLLLQAEEAHAARS